ncbi:hypothetical protein L2E82_42936 [Cichorium intybus]|uniref:Uncharacterized protein n=1 Tax=Cichorium intybus TaxID=13427 RepID=A0ACB8ZMW5_CICIN|nr:hypothetical protein L2E82_42936 [Cichorium intybus]
MRDSAMAIGGDLRLYAALRPSPTNLFRTNSSPPSKVNFRNFVKGGSTSLARAQSTIRHSNGTISDYEMSTTTSTIGHDNQSFLFNAINMSFLERLSLAWKIIFPSPSMIRNSNANIAKQRLKMILFSDRCAVSDEAKQKIVSNVVNTLSDFVVIEPEEKVQLSISTDSALGTIYSVTVPVRRVRSEYQEEDEAGTIVNVEYKDTGVTSGSVDVKFDFYVPSE